MEIKDGLSAAVLEVLDKDNYVAWSAWVKTYLIAQDLWETIEATTEPPKQEDDESTFKAWSNKNSTALHVLQVSCGPDILPMIRKISSAKIAWNTLAVILQVLKKDNYVDWSVRVKNYLTAHHLWEIIEETTQPPMQEDGEAAFKAWTKKNSTALHLIQISCGPDSFSEIIGISSAKIAWDSLAKKFLHVDLEKHNYVNWSVRVKTYLVAHHLWEIIEATTQPPRQEDDEVDFKAWSKKNSMALHVIQISCELDSFSKIIGISSAKVAWDSLVKKFLHVDLEKHNYVDWSVQVKTYLVAHHLWKIIKPLTPPPKKEDDEAAFKAWSKKNSMALHVIQITCGPDLFSEIIGISSAAGAWVRLGKKFKSGCLVAAPLRGLSYEPLRMAINRGNKDAVIDFLSLNEDAKTARISKDGGTVLHLAVFAGHTEIVEKLVDLMSMEELEIKDENGCTALLWAAVQQINIGMIDCMLRKNSNLLNIPDHSDRIPLIAALEYGNIEVAHSLYSASLRYDQRLSSIHTSTVLSLFIDKNNFDLALHLLHRCQDYAFLPNKYGSSALNELALNPSAFLSGNQLVFWKRWIYACIPIQLARSSNEIQIEIDDPNDNPNQHRNYQVRNGLRSVLGLLRRLSSGLLIKLLGIKQLYEMKLLHHQAHQLLLQMCSQVKQMNRDHVKDAVFIAVRSGIVEFIDEILKVDDTLVSVTDEMGRGILFYAVLHRQAKAYRLIYEIVKNNWFANVRLFDKSGNTLLHMAAMLEPCTTRDRIAGEALKMQSELQWFKAVERICPLRIKDIRNDTNMTARELFTHNHKNMMKEGEKWAKEVASACTVIGALIITIMFTAAFTVPGGYDQDKDKGKGFPIFSHERLFRIFIISDTLSFIFSSTSVLVFLGIVTSRYAEEDFYQSLPLKMMIGHCTLMFSIVTMMIAFCVGLLIILPEMSWMVTSAGCLVSYSVIQFAYMLFPLLVYMLKQILKSVLDMRYL